MRLPCRPPQAGHSKPFGQREAITTARHFSSVPYSSSNAASLSPFWNCTRLRAMAVPSPSSISAESAMQNWLRKEGKQELIWDFYADLKLYRLNPSQSRRLALRARFDRIFRRRTGFVTLDRLLARLHANKAELLRVLERPEIPLHTNGSENDIRCQVIHRKVSAGTRSEAGRDCRDAFLGLAKTCAKHAIAFWDYLGSRLNVAEQALIPYLPDLIRCRGQPV